LPLKSPFQKSYQQVKTTFPCAVYMGVGCIFQGLGFGGFSGFVLFFSGSFGGRVPLFFCGWRARSGLRWARFFPASGGTKTVFLFSGAFSRSERAVYLVFRCLRACLLLILNGIVFG
jgi:hypothetical protein